MATGETKHVTQSRQRIQDYAQTKMGNASWKDSNVRHIEAIDNFINMLHRERRMTVEDLERNL